MEVIVLDLVLVDDLNGTLFDKLSSGLDDSSSGHSSDHVVADLDELLHALALALALVHKVADLFHLGEGDLEVLIIGVFLEQRSERERDARKRCEKEMRERDARKRCEKEMREREGKKAMIKRRKGEKEVIKRKREEKQTGQVLRKRSVRSMTYRGTR